MSQFSINPLEDLEDDTHFLFCSMYTLRLLYNINVMEKDTSIQINHAK